MRELVHELIDAMDYQLQTRFSTTIRNVNLENRSDLFHVLDRYSHAEQVEPVANYVLKIDLLGCHQDGVVYGGDFQPPSTRLDNSPNDPVARMLRPYIQVVNIDRNMLGAMHHETRVTYSLELLLTDNGEDLLKNLIAFFRDPEWFEYSEEFNEEMSDLLSRDEV